jgi:D-ribose pyranase
MKKNGILNGDISRVLGYMRHTDIITIVDCGFPIPDGVECIDLSVKFGLPLFLDVLEAVSDDLEIELVRFANEIKEKNPKVLEGALEILKGREIEIIPHVEFKKLSAKSKVIIRTGEATPYANVILQSGCTFKV